MKKRILMIGNTNDLRGVPVDVRAYYSFFTSPVGGNWCAEEIEILMNPTQRCLFRRIAAIENADYDYVVVIFSGHGEESDDGTVLRINGEGETITLDDLTNLSPRQLLIIDCCRSRPLLPADFAFGHDEATILSMSRDPIRQAYEERIWDSMPQEVILYACDDGEKSFDSSDGGVYSHYLLNAAQMLSTTSCAPFVSVGRAHFKAVSMMRQDNPSMAQHPQILQPRCPANRQLPLAVNANLF